MSQSCGLPPRGWRCTRTPGHSGPCAAVQARPSIEQLLDEAIGELDQVVAEVRLGIRNAVHFDELEERVQAAGRKCREAFRSGVRP